MYVDLTEVKQVKQRKQRYWIKEPEFTLYVSDRLSIVYGEWLTDAVINCAQRLLKECYPLMGGLQPTTFGATLSYTVETGEFVQVIIVRGSHWITVSNIGCEPNSINIFDSIPYGDLSSRAREQIAALMFSDAKDIILKFPSVQCGNDCGLHLQPHYVLGLIQQTYSTIKLYFGTTFFNVLKGDISLHSPVKC